MTDSPAASEVNMEKPYPYEATLGNGRLVMVHGRVGDQYVVEYGHEDPDGEVYYDGFGVSKRVYAEPPTEAIDKTIQTLLRQERELRDAVTALSMQKHEAEKEAGALRSRLQEHEALKRVDDFLAGRFTHFVVRNYSAVTIQTKDSALETDSESRGWEKNLKLLTLFGKKDGGLQWNLNRYSDGSGSNTEVWPYCSLDEATAKAKQLADDEFAEVRERVKVGYPHGIDSVIKWATALGIDVPEDISALHAKLVKEGREKRAADLRKQLAEVES